MKLRMPPRIIEEVYPKLDPRDHPRRQSTTLGLIISTILLFAFVLGLAYFYEDSAVESPTPQSYEKTE